MTHFFDWHIHLTGSIPVNYWREILYLKGCLNGRSSQDLGNQLYMQNSTAWSDLKICTETPGGFRDTVEFVISDMISRGVSGANFIFNPYSLIKRGLDLSRTFEMLDPFLSSLLEERKFYPLFRIGVNRRDGIDELERVAKIFKENKPKYLWLEAIDINGDEEKYPLKPFISELLNLRKESLPYTIHAGEGLNNISSLEEAISCSPLRIGHGVSSVREESLVQEIKDKKIALELCVSSNLKTLGIPFEKYPLLELFETGMDILLGSDNPSFINSTIEREYSLIESIVGGQGLDKVESNTEKYLRRNNFF
ncbi:MAG: hypothetical protein WAX66_02760 [Patescibacteria group bacterium]